MRAGADKLADVRGDARVLEYDGGVLYGVPPLSSIYDFDESFPMTSAAVLLDPNAHRPLHVRADVGAAYGDGVMAALTVPDEFRHVQGHFPILFRKEEGAEDFMALAMLGLERGENLFLNGDQWDAPYRPWSLAVQPFLVGRALDGEATAQVFIDLASPRISAAGAGALALFDDAGEVTPFLDQKVQLLSALDGGFQTQAGFFAALQEHDLLQPLTLAFHLADGRAQELSGYHIINEQALMELDGEAAAHLHGQGYLQPIYMAMASLSQMAGLVDRKNRRLV